MTEKKTDIKTEVKLPTAQELLEAGVHFGHRTSAWHPKMAPYIFGARNNVHIFDLEKTLVKLAEALVFLKETMAQGGVVLLVGTKPVAKGIIKEVAEELNLPYVNGRWLGGTLTNYKTISKRLAYYRDLEQQEKTGGLDKYTKKERVQLKRKLAKLEKQLLGIKNLNRLPQALLACDVKADNIAIREAKKIKIPVVAIIDTNMDPSMIDYIIPANDDAVSSVKKIVDVIYENLKDVKVEVKAEEAVKSSPVLPKGRE